MTTAANLPAPWADRTGRTLLAIDALATLGAFAQGIPRVADAADEQLLTEFWRTTAYIVFAGMWALLAIAPREQRGMWELILVQKIAVTLLAIVSIGKPEAAQTAVIDGFVVVTTVAAYVLCRGWYTWRPGALGPDQARKAAASA
jgi:peptidoglycan/LPS O-acetylase OafA/YrhL